MASSTWRPASSDRWRLIALWSGILMPPVAFLGLLQTNYLLAYPACSYGTTTPLVVASGVTTLLVVGVSVAAWRWRQRADDPPARMFLGLMGILVNTLVLLMVIGLIVPPLILQPCD